MTLPAELQRFLILRKINPGQCFSSNFEVTEYFGRLCLNILLNSIQLHIPRRLNYSSSRSSTSHEDEDEDEDEDRDGDGDGNEDENGFRLLSAALLFSPLLFFVILSSPLFSSFRRQNLKFIEKKII